MGTSPLCSPKTNPPEGGHNKPKVLRGLWPCSTIEGVPHLWGNKTNQSARRGRRPPLSCKEYGSFDVNCMISLLLGPGCGRAAASRDSPTLSLGIVVFQSLAGHALLLCSLGPVIPFALSNKVELNTQLEQFPAKHGHPRNARWLGIPFQLQSHTSRGRIFCREIWRRERCHCRGWKVKLGARAGGGDLLKC